MAGPNILALPDYEAAISGAGIFRLTTDASVEGFGAVPEQQQEEEDGDFRPLVYISRSTLPTETNRDTTDRECGALVWAVKKLSVHLYGIPFLAFTDPSSHSFIWERRSLGYSACVTSCHRIRLI